MELSTKLGEKALKSAGKKTGPLVLVNTLVDMVSNPWHNAMVKASMTGIMLADAISRTPGWTFTLAGHSLGARVIYYALEALSTREDPALVENVYLLGGAVGGGDKEGWLAATKAVNGTIFNCFSKNDNVLKYLYQGANAGLSTPIGYREISLKHRQIENLDCSSFVDGHSLWKAAFGSILTGRSEP